MMTIKKRNEIMEKAIQQRSVAKMKSKPPKRIFREERLLYNTCCITKLPILEDSLPNSGMTRLVVCVASNFHEGADLICISEDESRPKKPYVLLNEINVTMFKGDSEEADELLDEIKSLETLPLHDKRNYLQRLIRPNRYLDKTALIIAAEKKDAQMVKILLRNLPPKLLDQTDSNGKTACHYACDNAVDDQELTKEVVKVFLDFQKNASPEPEVQEFQRPCSWCYYRCSCNCCRPYQIDIGIRQIDLFARDNTGRTAFDYLHSELKSELASEYPEFFSEV